MINPHNTTCSSLDVDPNIIPPSLPETVSIESQTHASLVQWLAGFLMQLHTMHRIPDSAVDLLLKFLYTFFCVLGHFSDFINAMVPHIPSSLHRLKQALPMQNEFKQFVVSTKCWKLYHYVECVEHSRSFRTSKTCTHVGYPDHPHRTGQKECGNILQKSVTFLSGKKVLLPQKVYCYKSLQSSLRELLVRPGLHKSCQHWRLRAPPERMSDIYDGKVWSDFLTISGQPFLQCPFNLAVMLNIDWFQPFKHTPYSIGAVYLTIMNLPRNLRFKRENVILLALIPGPSEPAHDINAILDPMVRELTKLWEGVEMEVHNGTSVIKEVVRCALLCCACDLPAGRKVCGFLGHSASLGCSKCLKPFQGTVGNMNYSGFDRPTWPLRTNAIHRKNVQLVQRCTTKTEKRRKESQLGCRYSALLELPYFDPPRMLIIDPMHNLFLGTAKHMLKIWEGQNLLSRRHFQQLQESVDGFTVPPDVGRIPHKIQVGFSDFTADQFKNWIIYFSIPAIYDILTEEHRECWRHFVLACRILCKHRLSKDDVCLADALLLHFCRRVQHLYGEYAVTPNMHMHAHLKEDILNYGPVYGFWLFSFERYNGVLGNQPTNNKAPEPQLMRRFIDDNSAYSFQFPNEFKEDFSPLCTIQTRLTGSVAETLEGLRDTSTYTLPSRSKYSTLDVQDIQYLHSLLTKLRPSSATNMSVPNAMFLKYTYVTRNGQTIGYLSSESPCIAMAEWDVHLYGTPPSSLNDPGTSSKFFRPVRIKHFAKVSVTVEDRVEQFVLARVEWYQPHPCRNKLGKPAQVWCHDLFEHEGLYSFLSLDKIISRCVYCTKILEQQLVLIVVPIVE